MIVKRFILPFVLAVLVCTTGAVFAASGISVKASKGFNTELEVNAPELKTDQIDVLGKPALSLSLPNGQVSFEKGAPALPYFTALVMIDPKKNVSFKVSRSEAEVIPLDMPVAPSKGNFTRDVDPSSVPYTYGETYTKDAWYPSDDKLVAMDSPFIFRDIRGVRLLVNPVQYNPVQNKIRIHRNFTVTVEYVDGKGVNTISKPQGISKVYEPIYRKAFVNFAGAAKRLPRLEENGRLLIICHDSLLEAIGPFVAWKQKCGIAVVVAKSSEAGATNKDILAFIQKEYDKGGLTHIMIVGDAEQVPTLKGVKENADSDPCYTKLAGNDHVPDCIISRLSATTPTEVAYQVAKFVNYEQFPSTGDDAKWYHRAVGIASNQGNPTDFARCEELRVALEAWKFVNTDKIYDPTANKAMVAAAVNEGRSLINYIGHGSTTSWGTTYFSNTDCAALTNGWKMPIIWSVACVNGAFVGKTCFCEAWMRSGDIEKPRGAVAIFGASTNQEWVPPCIVQAEISKEYIVKETYKTVGGLAMNGIIKGLEVYGTEPKGSGVMMLEQWHLFGDGTLLARFKAPTTVTVKAEAKKADDESVSFKVVVLDAEGKAVPSARVCIYTEKVETSATAFTNDQGEAAATFAAKGNTYVTVTGADLVPVVDQKIEF